MTTRADISNWFDVGVSRGATHLVVVCDEFDWSDYPKYVMPTDDVRQVVRGYRVRAMSRVVEVYHLSLDKATQLAEERAFHLTDDNPTEGI